MRWAAKIVDNISERVLTDKSGNTELKQLKQVEVLQEMIHFNYAKLGSNVTHVMSSFSLEQQITTYSEMQQSNGLLMEVAGGIQIQIPANPLFNKYEQVMFSAMVLPQDLETQDRKKVYADKKYHTGKIISNIVSIEAKAFAPGWGEQLGGWIEKIPVKNF